MMKKRGDDTEFEVDLGGVYSFDELQLDNAVLENSFCNFYESWNTDFRKLGVNVLGTLYEIVVD